MRAALVMLCAAALAAAAAALAEDERPERPSVLVIFAADIGPWNLGAYHRGLVGGATPNLDRLAEEGALFTDAYGHAEGAAARAAFLTGQLPVRSGVLRGPAPGAPAALAPEDPTLAELLREEGYAAGHFGPSLLGDRNEALPTARGFDAFFGPLHMPDAEGAPDELRGVLRCRAAEEDDLRDDPRFGRMGRQRCEDTGPFTRQRMETIEEEVLAASLAFMREATAAGKPFFVWHNTTRMHPWTRLAPRWQGKSGHGLFADGMLELDHVAGELLGQLEALGVADSTLVIFTSDRGPRSATWPDGGTTPFRGTEGTSWEAAVRVPLLLRWPGRVQAGAVSTELVAHEDWLPTLLAAAGRPDLPTRLREGHASGRRTWRVHVDGHDQLPLLLGFGPGGRREYLYFADDGALRAVRVGDWKLHLVQPGGEPLPLAPPLLVNLRIDPLERTPASALYGVWHEEKQWVLEPLASFTTAFLASFDGFPPRRPAPAFDVAALRAQLQALAARSAAR
jgi:arylsulfatase